MTLKEAVATGKRFKRGEWEYWYTKTTCIWVADAIADDWEVERVKKEGWVNIKESYDAPFYRSVGHIYKTEQEAREGAPNAVATIKIEWEE